MKKALLLSLLLILLLLGCQGTPQAEALTPTPAATEAPTAVPTVAPTPIPSAEQIIVSVAPVTFTPPATPDPTPSPVPTPEPTPAPTPFTMVWMSDTQHISRNHPEVFNAMRDWILNNREKENIQFVAHTGDVVDGIGPGMFENANNALVPLFETLPGMVVYGNHDVVQPSKPWHFTQQPFAKLVQKEGQTLSQYEGSNVYAAYVTFRACDTDFLVFGVGFDVVCYDWMNEVIAKYPDHVVIVIVHKGLQPDGDYSKETRYMFLNVMPQWPNFRLILCGHERGTQMRTDWFDDDGDSKPERSVTTMMFNYQDDRKEGLGFLRLLRFNPIDHSIEVLTYSPWFDQWGYPKATDEENHFILINAW